MKYFIRRYQRLRTMERILEEYSSVYATRPELIAMKAEFTQQLDQIGALISKLARSVRTIYRTKTNISDQYKTTLLKATSVLVNLSSSVGDVPTLRMLKDYKQEMEKVSGQRLYETGLHVEELLTSKAEDLVNLGFVAADLQVFSDSLIQFNAALREKDFQLNNRRTAWEELRQLFKLSNDLVKDRIDTAVMLLSTDNPIFYVEYMQARRKRRKGKNSTEVEGVSEINGAVTDAVTGEPVAGAQITLVQLASLDEADEDGMFDFSDLHEGKYTLGCFAPGYQVPENQEVTLSADDIVEVNFTLQPVNPILN